MHYEYARWRYYYYYEFLFHTFMYFILYDVNSKISRKKMGKC